MKCQASICTVAFLCWSLDTLFSVGKTLLEPRDVSYAVINAIMKMKIAIVATRKRQWRACELRGRKIHCWVTAFRDCVVLWGPLWGSTVYLSVSSISETNMFYCTPHFPVSTAFTPDICKLFQWMAQFPLFVFKKGEGSASLTILPEWFICRSLKNSSFESVRLLRWRSLCRGDTS